MTRAASLLHPNGTVSVSSYFSQPFPRPGCQGSWSVTWYKASDPNVLDRPREESTAISVDRIVFEAILDASWHIVRAVITYVSSFQTYDENQSRLPASIIIRSVAPKGSGFLLRCAQHSHFVFSFSPEAKGLEFGSSIVILRTKSVTSFVTSIAGRRWSPLDQVWIAEPDTINGGYLATS
jgi:hypothetical protein